MAESSFPGLVVHKYSIKYALNLLSYDNIIALKTTDNMWIGFHDQTTEGTFEWVDGTTVDYTKWMDGTQSTGVSYNFVLMNILSNGTWENVGPLVNAHPVCTRSKDIYG